MGRKRGAFFPLLCWILLAYAVSSGKQNRKLRQPLHIKKVVLDINRVPEERLCLLPGIGAGRARRIVDERARKGFFRSPEDLIERVDGMGPRVVKRILPFIIFGKPGAEPHLSTRDANIKGIAGKRDTKGGKGCPQGRSGS